MPTGAVADLVNAAHARGQPAARNSPGWCPAPTARSEGPVLKAEAALRALAPLLAQARGTLGQHAALTPPQPPVLWQRFPESSFSTLRNPAPGLHCFVV